MRLNGIIGVIILGLIIIAAIILGNVFFEEFLGVNVSKLPAGLKFIVHLVGLGAVVYILKKVFVK